MRNVKGKPTKGRPSTRSIKLRDAVEQYRWGIGSTVAMIVVVLCIVFLPLGMGPVRQPPMSILFIFPILMAIIFFYFNRASK
ncbi:hypothetical protein LIER_01571 [Lithospermum erythrorhizon]|uniref:Transmembrane protein n=1 Tax=Lithospermum erythrorhizon TaxID=34254 RepID=A0AAV3NMU7_LITER